MNSYFQKIQVEISYPLFDKGYDKTIESIHYQVTYPDFQGKAVSRGKCFKSSRGDQTFTVLQPAIWNASSIYSEMIFNFLKPDKPSANVIIRRMVYFKKDILGIPDKHLISQISINTDSDEINEFKVNDHTERVLVQNFISICIGEIGSKASQSSSYFRTEF